MKRLIPILLVTLFSCQEEQIETTQNTNENDYCKCGKILNVIWIEQSNQFEHKIQNHCTGNITYHTQPEHVAEGLDMCLNNTW